MSRIEHVEVVLAQLVVSGGGKLESFTLFVLCRADAVGLVFMSDKEQCLIVVFWSMRMGRLTCGC